MLTLSFSITSCPSFQLINQWLRIHSWGPAIWTIFRVVLKYCFFTHGGFHLRASIRLIFKRNTTISAIAFQLRILPSACWTNLFHHQSPSPYDRLSPNERISFSTSWLTCFLKAPFCSFWCFFCKLIITISTFSIPFGITMPIKQFTICCHAITSLLI